VFVNLVPLCIVVALTIGLFFVRARLADGFFGYGYLRQYEDPKDVGAEASDDNPVFDSP